MMPEKTMLDAALSYAARGWAVFPLGIKSKTPMIKGGNGCSDATTDQEQIKKWWDTWPDANIGVNVGMSGFLAIDVDPRNGGDDSWHELKAKYGLNDDTITNLSGRGDGGFHLLYATNGQDVSGFETKLAEGVDVKRGNQYIIVEPSIHPTSGKPYQWDIGYHPDDIEPRDLPPSLLLLLSKEKGQSPIGKIGEIIPQGERDDTLASLAGSMRRRGMSESAIFAALIDTNEKRCKPPLARRDIERIAKSIARYEVELELSSPLYTDFGNATRYARDNGDKMKYTESLGWFVWGRTHWKPDETGARIRLARKTVEHIFKEAEAHVDEELADKAIAWAMQSQSRARVSAMLELARYERQIIRLTSQFDQEPWLFNCANGTLNLKTGELTKHDPGQLISYYSPVAYDPNAKCPRWDQFLNEIFEEDQEVITYVQKAVGYSLTGSTIEQCLFFLHGCGSNGKTTLTQAVFENVLANYAKKANVQTILHKDRAYINNDVARLRGARAVLVSEIPEGRRLNEPLVKDLTGNDIITARFLNKEYFEFRPTFKMWMYGNHKPVIRGTDLGIWRRLRLIPFNVTFSDDEKDEMLPEKLALEASGILTWAVQGCFLWQCEGLDSPRKVAEATKEYRSDMDVIGVFLAECTREGANFSIKFAHLYAAYDQWCEKSNERKESKRKFGERLVERGLEKSPGTGNVLYVHGIGMLDDRTAPIDF